MILTNEEIDSIKRQSKSVDYQITAGAKADLENLLDTLADLQEQLAEAKSHRHNVIGAKPVCLDCNAAGIVNCSHFDNCAGKWVYAASREIMKCGHPKSCWHESRYQLGPDADEETRAAFKGSYCTLCAELAEVREAAEEAALTRALWEAKTLVPSGNGDYQLGFLNGQAASQESIEKLIPVGGALDRIVAKAVREANQKALATIEELSKRAYDGDNISWGQIKGAVRVALDADGSTPGTGK